MNTIQEKKTIILENINDLFETFEKISNKLDEKTIQYKDIESSLKSVSNSKTANLLVSGSYCIFPHLINWVATASECNTWDKEILVSTASIVFWSIFNAIIDFLIASFKARSKENTALANFKSLLGFFSTRGGGDISFPTSVSGSGFFWSRILLFAFGKHVLLH